MAERGPGTGKQGPRRDKAGTPRQPQKGAAARTQEGAQPAPPPAPAEPAEPARLARRYAQEVAGQLMRELKIDNPMRVPRLEKIVINMGLGEAREDAKLLDAASEELAQISGQKPVVTRARKAISNFKLRAGMPVGLMVTLRRTRMYEFFDRLVSVVLPRVRDFRGVSERGFDGRGNYALGVREHTIFPELNLDKVERVKGFTVSIVTTAQSDFEGYMLLKMLGMPFRGALSREEPPRDGAAAEVA